MLRAPPPPDEVAHLDEAAWHERVYQGAHTRQATPRALITGGLLGFLLAFTNLYIGLKTPWAIGVAITACLLSFSLWRALAAAGFVRTPLTLLESNCMQSTASAAGYSTGSTMSTAVAGLLILSATPTTPRGQHLPWPVLAAWTALLAALGLFMAIPAKRALINRARLPFPSGTAAATLLYSLHHRAADAAAKTRRLLWGALASGVIPLLTDARWRRVAGGRAGLLPSESRVFDVFAGWGRLPATGQTPRPSDWTLLLDHKLLMVAAGALVGLRLALSMLIAAGVLALWLGPAALAAGAITEPAAAWRDIGVWVGAPMMVASSLVGFAAQGRGWWRGRRTPRSATDSGPRTDVDIPTRVALYGVLIAGLGIAALCQTSFAIPWPVAALAVVLTFALSIAAARVTGESDITPIGPLGQLMQVGFGVAAPQNAAGNLMTAGLTAGAAAASADLLTDWKAGHLLGADPRKQFLAQAFGVLVGTVATVVGFRLLVPDALTLLGTPGRPPEFPAPGAQSWLAVSRVLQGGLATLHPWARRAAGIGFVLGLLLGALEAHGPQRIRRVLPSATGLALGVLLPFQYPLSMVIGAGAAALYTRRQPARADEVVVPLASGAIAGESIVGVVVAALNNTLLR